MMGTLTACEILLTSAEALFSGDLAGYVLALEDDPARASSRIAAHHWPWAGRSVMASPRLLPSFIVTGLLLRRTIFSASKIVASNH